MPRTPLSRTTASRAVAAAACAGALVTLAPVPAYATRVDRLVRQTNNARERHSLHDYSTQDLLTSVAQKWAAWMAAHRVLEHNPSLLKQIGHWCYAGENIARGDSERGARRELMHSRPHRRNILSKHYTQIGIGTHWDGAGHLYVDQVFRRPC